MRWWMRFFDAYFGPSLTMIGWSVFVGPAVRQRTRGARAAIDRIPLESRRIAWRKAMFNEFSASELDRIAPPRRLAPAYSKTISPGTSGSPGTRYSLGDINGFNLGYALPLSQPDRLQRREDAAHHGMAAAHLRASRRPRQTWAKGRTALAARVTMLERKPAAAP